MKGMAALAGLTVGLLSATAFAQSINITQMQQANVYAVVQVGSQVRPVTITQTGRANMAGVMQAGGNPRASISQTGQSNSAFIGQYDNILARSRSLQMP